jgi:hypothetical protein
MLWGDEMVSVSGGPQQLQVSDIHMPPNPKTVVQAHETVFLGIGTITPGNQSVATALATLRKQLAKRQGDSPSHGVARKHR